MLIPVSKSLATLYYTCKLLFDITFSLFVLQTYFYLHKHKKKPSEVNWFWPGAAAPTTWV